MPEENKQQPPPATVPPTAENALAVSPQPKSYPMREMLAILKDTGDADLFKAFAHDIIEREVAQARYGQDYAVARTFAESGAFDGIQGTNQGVALAMTKIQLGRSWNMQPADAMESVFFINGRPSVATRYLSAKMQDAGIAWDVAWDEDNGTCTGCHLHLKRWNPDGNRYDPIMGKVNGKEQQAVVSFTKKDADGAMIHEGGKKIKLSEKWNFISWPSDMYFARCVSRVRTRYAPNILSGVLTREEAEDAGDGTKLLADPSAGAATATQAKTEALSEKLKNAKKPEAPAVTEPAATTATAATAQPAATVPWTDRPSMNSAITAQKTRIGQEAFDGLLAKHNVLMGSLKFDDPKAAALYAEMVAAPMATTPEDVF